jgi:hypothetical protein
MVLCHFVPIINQNRSNINCFDVEDNIDRYSLNHHHCMFEDLLTAPYCDLALTQSALNIVSRARLQANAAPDSLFDSADGVPIPLATFRSNIVRGKINFLFR